MNAFKRGGVRYPIKNLEVESPQLIELDAMAGLVMI
jgi:hypothetical protein